MPTPTPTQRSLKLMRDQGYLCAITERWNPHAHIRQDLWGFCDVLCVRAGEVVAVQTTSGANVATRIAKMRSLPSLPVVLSAGVKVVVHGWRKVGARGKRKLWECRVEEVKA